MKRIVFILIFLFITVTAYADIFKIPFSVFPRELQAKFALEGKKLDLNGNDRTKDSWGFIENKGTNFIIYTYKPATTEDFNLIKQIIMQ